MPRQSKGEKNFFLCKNVKKLIQPRQQDIDATSHIFAKESKQKERWKIDWKNEWRRRRNKFHLVTLGTSTALLLSLFIYHTHLSIISFFRISTHTLTFLAISLSLSLSHAHTHLSFYLSFSHAHTHLSFSVSKITRQIASEQGPNWTKQEEDTHINSGLLAFYVFLFCFTVEPSIVRFLPLFSQLITCSHIIYTYDRRKKNKNTLCNIF